MFTIAECDEILEKLYSDEVIVNYGTYLTEGFLDLWNHCLIYIG